VSLIFVLEAIQIEQSERGERHSGPATGASATRGRTGSGSGGRERVVQREPFVLLGLGESAATR